MSRCRRATCNGSDYRWSEASLMARTLGQRARPDDWGWNRPFGRGGDREGRSKFVMSPFPSSDFKATSVNYDLNKLLAQAEEPA